MTFTVLKTQDRPAREEISLLTPVSAIKGLAYLLPLGELLRLWEPQKWILRPTWALVGYQSMSADYLPFFRWLTPQAQGC